MWSKPSHGIFTRISKKLIDAQDPKKNSYVLIKFLYHHGYISIENNHGCSVSDISITI